MVTKKMLKTYKSLPVQVRASAWFLFCSFLQKGIAMITTPIFTRIMSTSEYGHYGVFNSWLGIITIIVSLNMYAGVHAQGIVKFSNNRKQFTSSLQGLTTVLVSIWTVVYLLFHDFWNGLFSLTTVQFLSMMLIIWTGAIFSFWANEQRVQYLYRKLVIITVLVSVLKPVLEIVLVLKIEDKVTARILGCVIIDLMGYSWMFYAQQKAGKKFFSKQFWKYALLFNIPLIPHYLASTVLNSADRIMIQEMVGYREAGVYNLAYSISLIMTLFNTALMQTISPWMYQKIKAERGSDIAPIAYITLLLIAGVNLLLILLAPEVVAIFAPKEYYEAIFVIPPIAMSVYFMYAYDLFAKFTFYYEKSIIIMAASVSAALLNLILNHFFIKLFGYMAAGYTTLACFLIFAMVHYLFMRKVCRDCCNGNYPYDTKIIVMITIPFLITGFAFLATYRLPLIRYGILIAILGICFFMRRGIRNVVKQLLSLKNA